MGHFPSTLSSVFIPPTSTSASFHQIWQQGTFQKTLTTVANHDIRSFFANIDTRALFTNHDIMALVGNHNIMAHIANFDTRVLFANFDIIAHFANLDIRAIFSQLSYHGTCCHPEQPWHQGSYQKPKIDIRVLL